MEHLLFASINQMYARALSVPDIARYSPTHQVNLTHVVLLFTDLEDALLSSNTDKRRFNEFLGKRRFNEFLGKRRFSEFVGKRRPFSEFVGKRRPFSEFVGKRRPFSEFVGKRPFSEFLTAGKRPYNEFLGKREDEDKVAV